MGQFQIVIKGVGNHGCEQWASAGDGLRSRCNKLTCIDCLSYDFVQMLRQKGYRIGEAEFTHHVGAVNPDVIVVDDLVNNKRKSGKF